MWISEGWLPRGKGLFKEQNKLANFKKQEWFCCEVCSKELLRGQGRTQAGVLCRGRRVPPWDTVASVAGEITCAFRSVIKLPDPGEYTVMMH